MDRLENFLRNDLSIRKPLPIAPFIIGKVLGPTTEASFRQTLMIFKGNPFLIFGRPVATGFLVVAFIFIIVKIAYGAFYRRPPAEA